MVGWSDTEKAIQDFYVIRSGQGGCERLLQATSISMSGMLRLGGTLDNIEKAIKSDNKVTKQNGLISYLVFNLGIRIGGSTGVRNNGVVGASTLTVDTISFKLSA